MHAFFFLRLDDKNFDIDSIKMDTDLKYSLIISVVLIVLVIVSIVYSKKAASGSTGTSGSEIFKSKKKIAEQIIYFYELSKEDDNLMNSLLNSTISASKLNTLSQISNENELKKLEIDAKEVNRNISELQDKIFEKLRDECPQISIPPNYNLNLDWLT